MNNLIFFVKVYKFTDFKMVGDKSHKSISGGIASHSFEFVEKFKADKVSKVLEHVSSYAHNPYDVIENRLFLASVSGEENVYYELSFEIYREIKLNYEEELKELFGVKDYE